MLKKLLCGILVSILILTVAVVVFPVNRTAAQESRSIIPYPRGVEIETIDPMTRMPRSTFCIGMNTIDIKLTNNSGYRKYISVINRDTRGVERTLYSGWLESGMHYLSMLMRTQLALTGPAGTEMVRVDANEYGQTAPGNWVSFYVQDCGGWPPGGGYGSVQLRAWVYPYAIQQGQKGTITLQTSAESRPNMTYYIEILNSWGQLWKRIAVTRRPHERYQVTLPVGNTTKPGMLTYTAKLWLESGFSGQRNNVATTQFSFRVVTQGSTPPPYNPGYPGYPDYPGWLPYNADPYGTPYYGTNPSYGMPSYGMSPYGGVTPYGTRSPQGAEERQIQ
jgi:hypothetical protein